MRRAGALALLLAGQGVGCIDHLLEAPYVLCTGLGEGARSLSPSARESLLVGGAGGLFEVDGSGRPSRLGEAPVQGVVGQRGFLGVLESGALHLGPVPAPGGAFQPAQHHSLAGLRDSQAWCDDRVLLLGDPGLFVADAGPSPPQAWAPAPPGAIAIALGPGAPCAEALVLSPQALFAVSPTGTRTLAQGLVDARAAGVGPGGEVWVVQGAPLVLGRVREGRVEVIARYLGDVVDLHFGTGGLLHPANAYLLTREGSVDYVRVPEG